MFEVFAINSAALLLTVYCITNPMHCLFWCACDGYAELTEVRFWEPSLLQYKKLLLVDSKLQTTPAAEITVFADLLSLRKLS